MNYYVIINMVKSMIFKNDKYEDVSCDCEKEILLLIKNIVEYISHFGLSSDELEEIYKDMLDTRIVFSDGGNYTSINCERISTRTIPQHAAALHTIIEQQKDEFGYQIFSGVVLRNPNIIAMWHSFVHELFHAASSKRFLKFDNEKKVVTKDGIGFIKWDKYDNIIEARKNLALTEGITEMLTQGLLKEKGKNPYVLQVIMAKLLSKYDDQLIKDYFSRDEKSVDDFYSRFAEMQTILTTEEFNDISSLNINNQDEICKILKSCIEYCVSMANSKGIVVNPDEIVSIVSELDKSMDYKLPDFNYSDYCKQSIEDFMNKRHM